MQNLLDSLRNVFLNIYIVAPYIVALIFGVFVFFKNPISSRRFGILFFLIHFIYSSLLLLCIEGFEFDLFNISFHLEKVSSILIFISSLMFLIISILSKTFILKSNKAFWSVMFLSCGIINTAVLSDNILIIYLNIIWLFLLIYFLNIIFIKSKSEKKQIFSQLKVDLSVVIISFGLILYDFLRYFILNDIEFKFSNISENLYHINTFSTLIAFFGFVLLVFKMFNLIPLFGKMVSNSSRINSVIAFFNLFPQLIIGVFLFYKTYLIFAYLYWEYQDIIVYYLIFNFIYFLILSFRVDSVVKFLFSLVPVYMIMNLFCIFTFNERGLSAFLYSFVATLFSFCLLYFVLVIISNKFKTDKFEEFKKISSKNHSLVFFTFFSTLNMAGVPMLAIFTSGITVLATLFGSDFDDKALNFVPYILIIGALFVCITMFKIIFNILIAPVDNFKIDFKLPSHQMVALILLCFCIIAIGLSGQNIFGGLNLNINS